MIAIQRRLWQLEHRSKWGQWHRKGQRICQLVLWSRRWVRRRTRSQTMMGIVKQSEEFLFYFVSKGRPGSILCCKEITFIATWRRGQRRVGKARSRKTLWRLLQNSRWEIVMVWARVELDTSGHIWGASFNICDLKKQNAEGCHAGIPNGQPKH